MQKLTRLLVNSFQAPRRRRLCAQLHDARHTSARADLYPQTGFMCLCTGSPFACSKLQFERHNRDVHCGG